MIAKNKTLKGELSFPKKIKFHEDVFFGGRWGEEWREEDQSVIALGKQDHIV